MKQSATENKTNSVKSKAQKKISAVVNNKAKPTEKSVATKKAVPAKSVKLKLNKAEESKKKPQKIQKAKSLISVKKDKTSKAALPKKDESKKISKNLVSKKTKGKIASKSNAVSKTNLKAQNKMKTLTVKSVSSEKPKKKSAKPLVEIVKPKIRTTKKIEPKSNSIDSKVLKSETAKPKTIKVSATKTEISKRKPTAAKKSTLKNTKSSVEKKKVLTPKIAENTKQVSKSQAKKTVEKTPVNKAKNKITKNPVKKIKPEVSVNKAKKAAKANKDIENKSSTKTVSKPKITKAETISKSVERIVKPKKTARKISAKPQRKDILAYAKPAITGKSKPQTKIPAIKKIVMPKIEPEIQKTEKPKRKSVRAISQAVFRGEKDSYQFKVYEIDENFKEIPAVYVISKRITDKRNRGHHKLICIGETDSVIKDLKNHRKNKCLRTNKANVISILQEEDKEKRLQIETDLKAAHSIICNLHN